MGDFNAIDGGGWKKQTHKTTWQCVYSAVELNI